MKLYVYLFVRIEKVNGIINGDGHTISNINFTNNSSVIENLYGTLINIYINNFTQECSNVGGLIGNAQSGSLIDDVHMSDVTITKTGIGNVGGIVNQASAGTIRNSSVIIFE